MNKNTENRQVSGDLLKLNKQNKNLIPLLFLLGISLVGFWAIKTIFSNSIAKKEKPPKANLVKVATIKEQSVPVQLEAIGNVQSDLVVSITPQASGQITGVYFKKGQEVKKGQLLFTLDPRSQDASLAQARAVITKDQAMIDQARATLAKDQGQVEQARATLAKDEAFVKQAIAILNKDTAQAKYSQSASERYNSLFKSGAVSLDQAQQYTSTAQASKSTLIADQEAIANAKQVVNGDKLAIKNAQEVVKGDIAAIANAQAVKKTDQAALENLQVQASYTKIYSPIDGKAGNILINQGNIVQANSTSPLVTIARIRPIQVSFSIAEAKLPLVRKYISQGKLKVDVAFANDNLHSQGYLSFINNTIDSSTGTVQLIGDFENKEGHLFPGQFVNTTLTLSQMPKAKVVPSQAVQIGPNGQFVFVLDREEMTVQNVPVAATNTINGLSVLEKAEVEVGDEVVIDGQANLVSGDKVRVSSKGHHHYSPKKDSDS